MKARNLGFFLVLFSLYSPAFGNDCSRQFAKPEYDIKEEIIITNWLERFTRTHSDNSSNTSLYFSGLDVFRMVYDLIPTRDFFKTNYVYNIENSTREREELVYRLAYMIAESSTSRYPGKGLSIIRINDSEDRMTSFTVQGESTSIGDFVTVFEYLMGHLKEILSDSSDVDWRRGIPPSYFNF